MLRECWSAWVTEMLVGDGGCVVAVSAGHEYMDDTRGPGIVSSADEVLNMRGCVGREELVECVCVWVGAVWERVDERIGWVRDYPIRWKQGECRTFLCVYVAVV